MQRAIEDLQRYLRRKAKQVREAERLARSSTLNHRQLALMGHALRHADASYTIKSHQTRHAVVYQTARADLQDLEKRGLLRSRKVGKAYRFDAPSDLEKRLRELE